MKPILLILFTIFAIQAYSQAERRYIRKGNGEFDDGRYQQAEIEYRKALEKVPLSYKADYNLGNALYKQQQFDAAVTKYSALAEKGKSRKDLNRYYYNLGNALFESRKYPESVEAYKNALRNEPGDMDAKHNLQLAMKMLIENKQKQDQQDQQKNKDQQDKSGQKNDRQNQDQKNGNQQHKDQQQEEGREDQQQNSQMQPSNRQLSEEDAERILQALENEEKDVIKKIQEQKEHLHSTPLEKNW